MRSLRTTESSPHRELAAGVTMGSDGRLIERGPDMIHVLAMITAKPGMRETILTAFRANMPAVHAEKGCIEYGPAIDTEGAGGIQTKLGSDSFVVVEKWESLDDLKAHGASPHMAAYAAKTREMIANRVIHVLSPAG